MNITFNISLARQLAEASAGAYASQSFGSAQTDTQVLVLDLAASKYLPMPASIFAFRGTSNFRDALTDAKIALRSTPGGRVHTGIHDAVESILEPLSSAVRSRLDAGRQVSFTGHSLGGAEAALAAYVMAKENFIIASVYTFGGCRFCDAGFRNNYNALLGDATFRVVKEYDPVPHVPLPGLILPYRHVGHEIYLPATGGLRVDRSLGAMLLQDAWAMLEAWNQIRSGDLWLGDDIAVEHSITDYRNALASLQ